MRLYGLNSLPPGLFGDEALVTLHARTAVATGVYPIYFGQQDGGFHPAVVYATIVARAFTGDNPYAVRYAMAVFGILNIPLFFFAARAIFSLSEGLKTKNELALVCSAVLTSLLPMQLINRVGFEVAVSTTTVLLVFWTLAVALSSGRWQHYVLAGAALGLSLYTYYIARLLPVAVVLIVFWDVAARRSAWKQAAVNLVAVAATSAIVFAPLGWYFVNHPDMFMARASTTGAQTIAGGLAGLPAKLAVNTVRALAGILVNGYGDFIPRHNLPFRAVLDPIQSVLFLLGLIAAFRAIRLRSTAVWLTWFAVLMIPPIAFMTSDHPHFTRMMGAMPAMAGLAALGAAGIYEFIAARARLLGAAVVGAALVVSLGITAYDYFVRWANDPSLYDAFQVGGWRAASLALDRAKAGGLVFVSPNLIDDPSDAAFDLLLRPTSARQFPGPDCLGYYDRPQAPVTYVISTLHDAHTFDHVHALYPSGHEGATVYHEPDRWPLYQIFEVPAGAKALLPANPLEADFGGQMRLIGYDLAPSTAKAGGTLTVTLYWQALTATRTDFNAFIHLYRPGDETAGKPPAAQQDSAPCGGQYFTSTWNKDEIVVDTHQLTIPADFGTGQAVVAVGLYGWPSLERLEAAAAINLLPDNRLKLAEVAVGP